MNGRNESLLTVLDAGSQKSCVLVAEVTDGVLRYRGHGIQPSRGMPKSLIAELGPAAEAINAAAVTAEKVTKATIETAEAVLSADERELGVCLADIGATSTEMVVFFEGAVAHTAVLPIGGDHFTNDLAVGLHVGVEEAEQLKRTYGNCVVTAVPQLNEIEVGGDLSTGGGPARLVRQRFLAEILEPRARELLMMMRDNLRAGGVLEAMGAGCVFTGGGAHLA